ncbi:hypothetical protein BCU83_00670 [Vibrio breoganii]|nr:hypothetical protein BCU83_00670 [Vibrio breoganii]
MRKEMKILLSVHFILWTVIYLIAGRYGYIDKLKPFLYLNSLYKGMVLTFLIHFIFTLFGLAISRSKSPLSEMIEIYRRLIFNKRQIKVAIFFILLVTINSSLYTSFKGIIPKINYFNFDLTLAYVDKIIHFGISPWEISHIVLDSPYWSFAISIVYTLWLFAFWWFVCAIIFSLKDFRTKLLIISGYNFIWIINGSILALLFSSAGPCFFEYVVDGNNSTMFAELMNRLELHKLYFESKGYSFGVPATIMQEMLWTAHVEDKTEIGAGISAFPSMHVSVCMYMWLVTREYFKKFSALTFVFLIFVLVGSVHLGWHYAVDGYVSLVTTFIVWKLTQRLMNYAYNVHTTNTCSD